MNETPSPVLQTLELCVIANDPEAWADFFALYDDLVRRVFFGAWGDSANLDEFKLWFPGWLFFERKLNAALRALRRKLDGGECSSAEAQAEYFTSYLTHIIKTGIAEFRRERQSQEASADLTTFAARPAAHQVGRIEAALASLKPELRIPCWLHYYRWFRLPDAEDLNWIAAKAGRTAEEVARLLEDEAERYPDRKYPLSYEFIGELLGIAPSESGKFDAVSQGVKRAKDKLKSILTDEGANR